MNETATTETTTPEQTEELPEFTWGVGRRKTSVARVRIKDGEGVILVNKKPFEQFFVRLQDRQEAAAPLRALGLQKAYDVFVNVTGGGVAGQAGAVKLGLARALSERAPQHEKQLRDEGHMSRDAREKERKKYGRRGARARYQFSKR